MVYFKPPGARGQELHQDQFYLAVEPGTCVAAWIAIDRCDAENGAMMIVPKTNHEEVVCPGVADQATSFTKHYVIKPRRPARSRCWWRWSRAMRSFSTERPFTVQARTARRPASAVPSSATTPPAMRSSSTRVTSPASILMTAKKSASGENDAGGPCGPELWRWIPLIALRLS